MSRVKRLKEAIARLERDSVATEAQLEEEFEHGYAAGYNAGRADMDKKLRDLIADIALAAAFIGKDVADLPAHVEKLRKRATPEAGAKQPPGKYYVGGGELPPGALEFKRGFGLEDGP